MTEKPEARSRKREGGTAPARANLRAALPRRFRRPASGFWLLAFSFSLAFLPGCADDAAAPARTSGYERSDQALRDPMRYSAYPKEPGKGDIRTTGTDPGGGANNAGGRRDGGFDGDGLRKDLDHVFNP